MFLMNINDIFVRVTLGNEYENKIKKYIKNLIVNETEENIECALEILPYKNNYENDYHIIEKNIFIFTKKTFLEYLIEISERS